MSIRFSCICDHRFDLPPERAGTQLQCPQCLRLVDVPQINELSAFEDDGTLKMTDAHVVESALSSKVRAFSHREDLRPDLDTFLNVGIPEPDARSARPRYDPITGELLRPIDVRANAPVLAPQNIPLAKPVIGYNAGAAVETPRDLNWWQMPTRLLHGHSLMAMLFVFLAHVLVAGLMMLPAANLLLLPLVLLLVTAVIAHYGNVIDHIGPQNHDDIPVLMRGVSFQEDIWMPFGGFLLAFVLSFGPVLALLFFVPAPWLRGHSWALWLTIAFGWAVFPAMFLTANASGALQNLWPVRVARVILAAPLRYLLVVMVFLAGLGMYGLYFSTFYFASSLNVLIFGNNLSPQIILANAAVQTIYAALATYFLHLAAAWLALIYRTHRERFRWVLQAHIKRPRDDTLARLEALRKSRDPRVLPGARRPPMTKRAVPALPLGKPIPPVPQRDITEPRGFEVNLPEKPDAPRP